MSDTKRIFFVVLILLGGTFAFGYWSIHNFNLAFSNFDKVIEKNVANIISKENYQENNTLDLLLSTTTENNQIIATTSKLSEFKFTFPDKPIDVYKGCKYIISWKPKIDSLNISLLDAGTKEVMGPIAGGIPKNISGKNIENFEWKVGNVWPGKYYILATNINGEEIKEKSGTINIIDIPEGINQDEIERLCK